MKQFLLAELLESDFSQIPELPGVYQILNEENGRVYIGRADNLKRRIRTHILDLKSDAHHNEYLQRDFNYFGIEIFSYSILNELDSIGPELRRKERKWVQKLGKNENLYNYGHSGHLPNRLACHQCGKPLQKGFLFARASFPDEKTCEVDRFDLLWSVFICHRHNETYSDLIRLVNRAFADPMHIKVEEETEKVTLLAGFEEE